jgi:predicted DNA-binding transcriptional regulator YafY
MQASRLLSILMLLQTRGRMSARQLAGEFEVSERTILRDIDQLSAAGVPVYAERGRSGGFQLMDGYRTKLTGMTPSEAEALFLAGLPGPAAQLGLSDLLQAARLKLLAALPAGVAPSAERIAQRFHLDPEGWFRAPEPLPALKVVAEALWSGRQLSLVYRPAGEDPRARRLSPLGLVLKGGVWYLVALAGRTIRTYRVANVEDATVLDTEAERPAGFDLPAHWAQASRAYELGYYRGEAQVRLSPRGLRLLAPLGPHVVEAARASAGPPDAEGWTHCSLPIESPDDGVRELMRLGAEVEVVGPPALRARMLETLAAIGARYGP